jgi:hypothetical protein
MGIQVNVLFTNADLLGKTNYFLQTYIRYLGATNEFCHPGIVFPSIQNKVSARNSCKNGFLITGLLVEIILKLSLELYKNKRRKKRKPF